MALVLFAAGYHVKFHEVPRGAAHAKREYPQQCRRHRHDAPVLLLPASAFSAYAAMLSMFRILPVILGVTPQNNRNLPANLPVGREGDDRPGRTIL